MRRSVPASRSLPLAISVAVHGLAAMLLARPDLWRPVSQPSPPAEPPLEVELVETPSARAPEPGPAPVAPPARALDSSRRRTPDRPPPGPKTAPVGPPPPATAEPGAVPPPGPPPAPRGRPPVSLALDFRAIDRLTDRGVLDRPEAAGVPAPPPPPRPSTFGERLAARVRQDGARRNVAAGKVHPQVFDYMRDARKVFAPDPGTVDLDPRTPNNVRNSVKQWGGGLREAYRSWRRELDDLRTRPQADDPDRRGVPDILEHYNRILEGNRKGAEAIASQVCLVVAPGAPPRVELGQSSYNDEVDQAAVEALSRAARRRQPDPDLEKTAHLLPLRGHGRAGPPVARGRLHVRRSRAHGELLLPAQEGDDYLGLGRQRGLRLAGNPLRELTVGGRPACLHERIIRG